MAANPHRLRPIGVASYDVSQLSRYVPEAVGRARETRQPVLITDQDEAVAAIVSIEELDRLHDLEERAEVRQIVLDLEAAEAAEAAGEAEWYSIEDVARLQEQLLAEPNPGAGRPHGDQGQARPG